MASHPIRRGWFGWGGVAGNASESAPAGQAVASIGFAQPLRVVSQPAAGQFTATVNDVARTVTSVAAAGSTLAVTLAAPNLVAGDRITINYVPGGTAGTRLAYLGPPVVEFEASSMEVIAG